MSKKSKIEWTDVTWNPVTGCTKASAGCQNCYAERMAKRLKAMDASGYADGFKPTMHPERLTEPMKWKKPKKIFVCSMGDLFHEDVTFDFIGEVFWRMAQEEQHTFQVLTKRPARMVAFFNWLRGKMDAGLVSLRSDEEWPLPNVWLGVTAENQEMANERIPLLLECPAAPVRFVSCEPLLGPIDFTRAMFGENPRGMNCFGFTDGFGYEAFLQWVIVGGESGQKARPMHPEWAWDIRDQCIAADVPLMFKQWGEWQALDPCMMSKTGKKKAGRALDGKTWDQFPDKGITDKK